jgi:hypothetical protein
MLINMDPPAAEGNFCDDSNHPVKPHILERYNWHTGDIDNGQQLFDELMYLQVDYEIVFPPSGSNSTQQLNTVIFMWGLNISFW